jgi:hypothetical protein
MGSSRTLSLVGLSDTIAPFLQVLLHTSQVGGQKPGVFSRRPVGDVPHEDYRWDRCVAGGQQHGEVGVAVTTTALFAAAQSKISSSDAVRSPWSPTCVASSPASCRAGMICGDRLADRRKLTRSARVGGLVR